MTDAMTGNALDRSMVRAITWNAAARWSAQILSWACTILVARLLAPSDYGLVGMAAIYIALGSLVGQVGITDAVIAMRTLSKRQIAELNTVAMLVGLGLIVISCAAAYPLAHFFSAPSLRAVIIVTSITYLFNGTMVVPRALLQKELRFKLLAGIETVRALSQTIATLGLAWMGFGYWSLVGGQIVGIAVGACLTLHRRRHEFAVPHFSQLRRELHFSSNQMVTGISWYVYSNADFIVAGRMLGQAPLGDYTLAWTISSAPIEKIGNLITAVTPAFFSAIQHDKAELRRYLLRLTEALSYITAPASIGIALVSDYIVPVLLGSKWVGVIAPLRLLGLLMAFRSLAILPGRVLTALGETSFVMWLSVASAIIMPASFFVGGRWGTTGIATAWIVAFPPIILPEFYRTFRRIDMPPREFVLSVMPALRASAVMAAFVIITRFALPALWSLRLDLALLVTVGAVAYICTLLLFDRVRIRRILSALRSNLAQRPVTIAIGVPHQNAI